MAHKSKTQRAKAAVAKANKKDRQLREEAAGISANSAESASDAGAKPARAEKKDSKTPAKRQSAAAAKSESKPKKTRFQFIADVRAEMKRVTWPSRTDVIRWSGVVIGALIFFGVYVAILDSAISNGLVALAGLKG